MCPAGTAVDWQCEDPAYDCPAGTVCCAPGATLVLGGSEDGMQCKSFASHFAGTQCLPLSQCPNANDMGNIVLCTSNGECPSGQTCTPFVAAGNQVGGCI